MSAEEAEKATDASGGDEEEWLYGDECETKVEEEAPNVAVTGGSVKPEPTAEEVRGKDIKQDAGQEDDESDSDSDDDENNVCVTIGAIVTGGSSQPFSALGSTPVNLNIKAAGRTHLSVGPKSKGVDLDAQGSINGMPVLEVDVDSIEDKPWRKPGSDLSDYFNYGFNEDTWKAYCEKQKRLRMGYDGMRHASATKITVQQGRSGHGDREGALPCFRLDYSSPSNQYKPDSSSRKSSGTVINVIGGQTGTISRVEGRRRHSVEGNNIQVHSEPSSEAELTPTTMPTFFPPNIPPPPFPPPAHNVSSAPTLLPPPRIPIHIPPPGYAPGVPPPTLIPSIDWRHSRSSKRRRARRSREREHICSSSRKPGARRTRRQEPVARAGSGRPGGYDGQSAPAYRPFPTGGYPPPPPPLGSAAASWAGVLDSAKAWEYYARRDSERERHKERERPRERGHDKDQSPSSTTFNTAEERPRHRDSGERGYERRHHRERFSRENEERHGEKKRREERRHKSSRSSKRRHDSEEDDSHLRHKHKKSKRSKDVKVPSLSADHENKSEHSE